MAQNKGGRNNHRYIAQKRNDKRRKSFTKSLQSAGSRNRNRGYDKAQTDNVQGACAERNRFGICGKKRNQRLCGKQTAQSACKHHSGSHGKRGIINLFYALHFTRTVIVADNRAHTLNNAVGRQI